MSERTSVSGSPEVSMPSTLGTGSKIMRRRVFVGKVRGPGVGSDAKPPVTAHTGGGEGQYQAKSIGELANNATAAAIANAVADAVGYQLFELPITAERVYAALHL